MIICSYSKQEDLIPHAYTAGATQRFASEFTSPAQGYRDTDYNMEIEADRHLAERMAQQQQGKKEFIGLTQRQYDAAMAKFDRPSMRRRRGEEYLTPAQVRYQAATKKSAPQLQVSNELGSARNVFYKI